MPRYLFRVGLVALRIAGEELAPRAEWFIGIETDAPLDCDDPRWGSRAPVSADGMTDDELRSFGVTAFARIDPTV